MIRPVLILAVLISLSPALVEGNRYSTKEYGCSLLAPEGWTLTLSIEEFLAKVESPAKDMSCGVRAQLFKEPVPIEKFIAGIEGAYGISHKGQELKSYLKPTLASLDGEENKEQYSKIKGYILDDAPTPEQLEKARKMAEDRGGISDLPEQTMASRIYILPPAPPEHPNEKIMLVYYIVRRTVGYAYVFTLPPGGFSAAIPFLDVILADANLRGLEGGRYALPSNVPFGPPKFGLIQGKVLRNGLDVDGVSIALYRKADDYAAKKVFMRTTSTVGGEFMITNVPPGRYYALTVEGMEGIAKPVYNLTVQEGKAFLTNLELSP
jgi:hypothetical protein